MEKSAAKMFGMGDEKVDCSVVHKKPARRRSRRQAKSESSVSLECSETSESGYVSASQNHWLQLFVHQKRERSGTPAQSPLTHVLLLLIWEQKKKGGNAKRETGDRQNPSPESQINRIKDRKKKLIANACQTYNTNSKSSTGTKTVCILFLIRIYEYLVALYFCEKQNHVSTNFWDLRKVLSITGSC